MRLALTLLLASGALSCRASEPAGSLRALTYNIHGFGPVAATDAGRAALRAATPDGALDALAEELRALELDVVALQEVGSRERMQELAELCDMHAAYFPGGWKGSGWEEGISGALLSRYPILEEEDRPGLPPYGEECETFSRFVGRVCIDVGGTQVAVYAAHMLPSWENTTHLRLAEIEALARAVERDLAAGRAALVLGDMNHGPDTEEHAAWLAAGFTDAFAAAGSGPPLTCDSLTPTERIDYAFAQGALRPESAVVQRHGRLAPRPGDPDGFALSDHLPLLVVFALE